MARYETSAQKRLLQEGAELWAYAFEETYTKENMGLIQKPIKGRIGRYVRYGEGFAPFKKNSSTELAMSKAVTLEARCYADTEEEAIEGFNNLIKKTVKWHEERIGELEKNLIPVEPKTDMNLQEALTAAREGHFVSNDYFSPDQSLHYYRGRFYYEDGAVVTEEFLEGQYFATNGNWYIVISKECVDTDKLKSMHERNNGRMLESGSYEDCRKSVEPT